jgi:hypothetical protein
VTDVRSESEIDHVIERWLLVVCLSFE